MRNFLDRLARRLGYVKKPAHPLTRAHFFDLFFSMVDPGRFFFVQIGAGDGKHADPLHPYVVKYRLRGVALEPQRRVFEALTETYREHPQVLCLNAALGFSCGEQTLWGIRGDDSLATFDRSHLPQDKGEPVGERVRVITWEDVLQSAHAERVDFLQMDCEGYDWELLKTFAIEKWKPKILNFESYFLSERDTAESRRWLERHGYTWFQSGLDTCAYRL